LLLLGGAARSRAVQAHAPALLGAPVVLPEPGEYVALGSRPLLSAGKDWPARR
jgi:xylulokinase